MASVTIGLPSAATDQRLRDFFAYWRSKAPPGALPGRQHIDPLDIPRLLQRIAMFDVHRGGDRSATALRFRFRLMGTGVVQLMGEDYTGRWVDETMAADVYAKLHAAFSQVCAGQAHYWERLLPFPNRDFVGHRRLALPLASDGATVDMIIGCYIPVLREDVREDV
jgi:hypothetical protein